MLLLSQSQAQSVADGIIISQAQDQCKEYQHCSVGITKEGPLYPGRPCMSQCISSEPSN